MGTMSAERRVATAKYIEEMLVELRSMGKQINADVLVYFVEMAMLEANAVTKGAATMSPGRARITRTEKKPTADDLARLFLSGDI